MTTTITPETPATDAAKTRPAAVQNQTLGILSLVLGALSVLTGFQPLLGIAAIVLGALALRSEPTSGKLAIWGIVTGALGAIGLVWTVLGVSFLLPFAGFAALGGLF